MERKQRAIKNTNTRILAIDGLRGVACLLVVFMHFFCEIFAEDSHFLSNNVTRFLFDGKMAVYIFFIISAYALSHNFVNRNDLLSILRPAIKRYPRLSLPVFVSAFIVYLLHKTHLIFIDGAANSLNKPNWFMYFLKFHIKFTRVLKYSFKTVFTSPDHSLNQFLWTMQYELLGSFILFSIFFIYYVISFHQKKSPILYVVILIPIFFVLLETLSLDERDFTLLLCFFFGVFLSVCHKKGLFIKSHQKQWPNIATLLIAVGLVVWGSWFRHSYASPWPVLLRSTLLVYILLSSSISCNFLESRSIQFLGKISFPLFLIQFPVMVSFTCFLIEKYYRYYPTNTVAFFIALSGVIASLCASVLFYPVEIITQKICAYIYTKFKSIFFRIT